MQEETTRKDNQRVAREELTVLTNLAVSLKAMVISSEALTRYNMSSACTSYLWSHHFEPIHSVRKCGVKVEGYLYCAGIFRL